MNRLESCGRETVGDMSLMHLVAALTAVAACDRESPSHDKVRCYVRRRRAGPVPMPDTSGPSELGGKHLASLAGRG